MKAKPGILMVSRSLVTGRHLVLLATILLYIPGILQAETVIKTVGVGSDPEAVGVNPTTNKI